MASVLALGAIGLVILSGNYPPPAEALFLFAVAGVLTLIHAVSYVCDRFGRVDAAMTTKADAKREVNSAKGIYELRQNAGVPLGNPD
jgi:hypothetical protein